MIIALVWLALALAATTLELLARRSRRFFSLGELMERIARRRLARVLLVVFWGFLGVHFFARSTVPPL